MAQFSVRCVRASDHSTDRFQLSERYKFGGGIRGAFDEDNPSHRHTGVAGRVRSIQVSHALAIRSMVHGGFAEIRTELLDYGPCALFKRRRKQYAGGASVERDQDDVVGGVGETCF